jgi:hypothetical protein
LLACFAPSLTSALGLDFKGRFPEKTERESQSGAGGGGRGGRKRDARIKLLKESPSKGSCYESRAKELAKELKV